MFQLKLSLVGKWLVKVLKFQLGHTFIRSMKISGMDIDFANTNVQVNKTILWEKENLFYDVKELEIEPCISFVFRFV